MALLKLDKWLNPLFLLFIRLADFIPPSTRRGMPSDVMQYAKAHAAFPHENTADQFFSESQFESYRRLGHYLATEVLDAAMDDVRRSADDDELEFELFRRVAQNWFASSEAVTSNFSRLTEQVDVVFERLRQSRDLDYLNEQFYPEWRTLMVARRYDETDLPAEHRERMWKLPNEEH